MKVLVFCNDSYHPAATVRAGLAPLAEDGRWAFDWVEDGGAWDPSSLSSCAAVLFSKSNTRTHADHTPWLVGEAERALVGYVRSGGGLVAVHSGTASYRDAPAVRGLLGGVFVAHPDPCDVVIEPRRGHALTRGVEETFTVHDEHYEMELDDAQADVFLRSRSSHGVQPGGWTRREGRGRVCVLTPGHFAPVWLHPSFQRLLENALLWAAAAPKPAA